MNKELIDECCDVLLDDYKAASVIHVKMTEEFIITSHSGLEVIYTEEAALDVVNQIRRRNGREEV